VWILKKGLKFPAGDSFVDHVGDWVNRARAVRLSDVTGVEPCRRSSIRVTTGDGASREFCIGAGKIGPIWAAANVDARDEFLTAMRAALRAS
jgi:hypothetical protein